MSAPSAYRVHQMSPPLGSPHYISGRKISSAGVPAGRESVTHSELEFLNASEEPTRIPVWLVGSSNRVLQGMK